jgi:hypothetical protein
VRYCVKLQGSNADSNSAHAPADIRLSVTLSAAKSRYTQAAYVDWRYRRAISGVSLSKAKYCLNENYDVQRSLIHAVSKVH